MPISNSPASDKWRDQTFIRVWDAQPQNLLKAEQLDILAAVIRDNWRRGSRILDLGCGTGKTEALILKRLPVARFTCVDRSEAMLDFARKRLGRFGDQCRYISADLSRPGALKVPATPFRFIITVDTIHEITDATKARLFRFCRDNLTSDGLLLILDRVALDLPRFRGPLASVLGRLQRVAGSRSGQFSDCFADPRHRDDEHPLALEPYFRLLRRAGFRPALLHLHFHKALIAAAPEMSAH